MNNQDLNIENKLSDEDIYKQLLLQVSSLISPDEPVITGLSNFAAVLKNSFGKISWVGFYLAKDELLYLGPFQGKAACTQIRIGNGVCGTSAAEQRVLIVNDVNNFKGHIACDSDSKSEIVLPILYKNNLIGVLDVDSYSLSAFNETDEFYLKKFINILCTKINFSNFILL